MNKKITLFSKIILIIFLFIGCQKNPLIVPYQNASFERNVQLVPDSVARGIAMNFNPKTFFNTANPYNHANYISQLDGDNQILAEHVLDDHSGKPALYIFDFIKDL